MAMPSSPPLVFPADFVAEFPAGAGVPFGAAWLRGAGIVPNTPANAGVPTALPINTLQFLGAANGISVSASPNPTAVAGPRPNQTAGVTITHSGGGGATISSAIISGAIFTLNNGSTTTPSVTISTATTGFYTCTVRTTVTLGASSGYVDWVANFTMS